MKMSWKIRKTSLRIVASLALFAVLSLSDNAGATTLESWTNANPNGSYAPTFTALSSATAISFAGYNIHAFNDVSNIDLFLNGGGANLLGGTWGFVAAASGSGSATYNDGTSVPGLSFGGVSAGYYDTYSQTIATIVGSSYTLAFDYNGSGNNNGFVVAAINSVSATPLPATLPLFASGLGALGLLGWRRKRKAQATA